MSAVATKWKWMCLGVSGLGAQSPTSSGSCTSPTARFLHLGVIGNWGPHNSLLWELPHALWDFRQHLWPLPGRCQEQTRSPRDTKMSSGSEGKSEELPPADNHTATPEYPPGNLEKEIRELHGAQFINNRCSQFLIHKCGVEAKVGKLTFILPHYKLRREPGS